MPGDTQQPLISSEVFAVLTSLFATILAPTLDILDHGKVTQFRCADSGRCLFRVKDPDVQTQSDGLKRASGNPTSWDVVDDFCFCLFYAKQCLNEKGASIFCKHVLAAKLAQALCESHPDKPILVVKEIDPQDFLPLLLASRVHLTKYD